MEQLHISQNVWTGIEMTIILIYTADKSISHIFSHRDLQPIVDYYPLVDKQNTNSYALAR